MAYLVSESPSHGHSHPQVKSPRAPLNFQFLLMLPGIVSDQPILLDFFNTKFISEPLSALPYY